MANVLESEWRTYEDHRDELLRRHEGEHVLIHGTEIAGCFATMDEAVDAGYRRYGNVPFLVERVRTEDTLVHLATNVIRPPAL